VLRVAALHRGHTASPVTHNTARSEGLMREAGRTALAHELRQNLDNMSGADTAGDVDCPQPLALIERQAAELRAPAVKGRVAEFVLAAERLHRSAGFRLLQKKR